MNDPIPLTFPRAGDISADLEHFGRDAQVIKGLQTGTAAHEMSRMKMKSTTLTTLPEMPVMTS